MRNKKKRKTIDDFSVAQLLDDFIKVDIQVSSRPQKEIDDEDYIRMMLKKDAQKKLERRKRDAQGHSVVSSAQSETIDVDIRQRFFPDVSERPIERKSPIGVTKKPPQEYEFVDEILDSIVVKDVSGLAAQMKEAVEFVQDEMGTSDAERKLTEALEEYGKNKKRSDPLVYNDNILLLKRCQNCHFCVGEKTRNDSLWCFCTNPDRSIDVEIEDSWVKSDLNLPCWKAPQN